jgi:hypothetical protein
LKITLESMFLENGIHSIFDSILTDSSFNKMWVLTYNIKRYSNNLRYFYFRIYVDLKNKFL